jgi:hypothetical protein
VPDELPGISTLLDGRYLLMDRLADGGMGTVFRAHDIRGRRDVAIKILKPGLAARERAVARFFVEARAAGRLDHPNVISIYDYGVSREGHLFLVMELLPGCTLAAFLARKDRLHVSEALLVAGGICEALIHAHDAGVVHRDLKPENVFLTSWDRQGLFVKVLDFGVAAIADAPSRGDAGSGEVLGTPAYMSPEQVRGDVVDRRSDLYSLGVLIHEMLAGCLPFPGDGAMEIMRQQLSVLPPALPPLPISATVRRGVDGLRTSLLAKDPGSRPADAREARARIRAVLDNLAIEDCHSMEAAVPGALPLPVTDLVPFHERGTMVFDGPLQDPGPMADRATVMLDRDGNTPCPPIRGRLAATVRTGPRGDVPWTVNPGPQDRPDPGEAPHFVRMSLVHIELDFGPVAGGLDAARTMFGPEMEAFETRTLADGGCVCFDSGDEVRIVFGLYSVDEEPWVPALRAAADLKDRASRFRRATGLAVDVRIGVVTDRVSSRTTLAGSPDAALRGAPVDVAARLSRMAAPGQVLTDARTRRGSMEGYDFQEIGRIRVRGRSEFTEIFGLADLARTA